MGDGRQRFWFSALTVVGLALLVVVFVWINPTKASAPDSASAESESLVIGEPAPAFAGVSLDGEQVSLDSLAGRPIWLVFNATWCTSCRGEIPDIQAVHESELGSEIELVSVYLGESKEIVSPFVDRLRLTYRAVPDPDSAISQAYRVPGVPVHYFIDAEGILRGVKIGSLGRTEMESQLGALLG